MSRYDGQLTALKSQLPQINNILVTLPAQISTDKFAAGLTLSLGLEKLGKKVSVVTEATPLVAHSNLYGVGNVKNTLAEAGKGGNLTITLGGVVAQDGTVPSLEKLDWFPQGQDLNLVFHVLPGQRFEPSKITPSFEGGKFDLIIVLGATSLNDLGSIYTSNPQTFSETQLINIDNSPINTQFGTVKVVDSSSASISEMVMQIMQDLGLSLDQDTASNILAGIYDATSNLTLNVKPETFMVVSQVMQAGGKVPVASPQSQPIPGFSQAEPQPVPAQPVSQPQPVQPQAPQPQPFDSTQGKPMAGTDSFKFITPTADNFTYAQPVNNPQDSQAHEEVPSGEFTSSSSIEAPQQPSPDWLTPKVYKGGSLG